MSLFRLSAAIALPIVGGSLFAATTAQALSTPDSGSCSASGYCLRVTDTYGSASATGLLGVGSGATTGVKGQSTDGAGVKGESTNGYGVWGSSSGIAVEGTGGIGVEGTGSLYGVSGVATSTDGIGVYAEAQHNGVGVYAWSNTSDGVRSYTQSTTAAAVSALSPSSNGLAFYGTGGIRISGSLAEKAGGGSWSAPSDERIKKDVKELRWGLDKLQEVRPVTFRYNGLGGTDNDGREYVGVIAQELEKIFPTMVTSRKAKLHKGDPQETDIRVVDPSAFTYILINAVNEQQRIIERQESRIASLERARGPLSASMLTGGIGAGVVMGLLSLGLVAVRRRKQAKPA